MAYKNVMIKGSLRRCRPDRTLGEKRGALRALQALNADTRGLTPPQLPGPELFDDQGDEERRANSIQNWFCVFPKNAK